MNQKQWELFSNFREEFKTQCAQWATLSSKLIPLQIQAAQKDTPVYPVQNPVVYNTDLDKITQSDDIRLIVIGDNPGKNEQLNVNKRYLCGQSGKIAEGFFRKNPELQIDFRKNVIILNKTPVHTAKTNHLRTILKSQDKQIIDLINESQVWMAKKTAQLHQNLFDADNSENSLKIQLWLVGYAELKGKGLFLPYRDSFFTEYKNNNSAWKNVLVLQHFSMNRFSIDLKNYKSENSNSLLQNLNELGLKHSEEIFN